MSDRQIRSTAGAKSLGGQALHPEGCLFCLRTDGGFRSEEHIFAEALGNTELVLPRGVVCDRCNNGPLSLADDALASTPAVALLLAERGIGGKVGKPRMVNIGGTQVWWSGPGQLNVASNSKRVTRGMRTFPGEQGSLELKAQRVEEHHLRAVVRAVWKSALEFIYLDHGHAVAYDAKYDDARAAVIDVKDAHGWALVPKEGTPNGRVSLTYQFATVDGRPGVVVKLDVYGVVIVTDLLVRDLTREQLQDAQVPSNIWIF